jgi:predicted nucleic acid-binding protein
LIVADTNIVFQLVVDSEFRTEARLLMAQDPQWRMPPFWRVELLNALATQMRTGKMTRAMVEEARRGAYAIKAIHEIIPSEERALDFVQLCGCSAYDALFLAAADQLGVKLVSLDKKLIQKAPKYAIHLKDQVK